MAAPWRVARSLFVLRDQIDARFPNRSRITDGYIGDNDHQNTTSDHNPWYGGIVTAADWTHDPRSGFDIDRFTDELAAGKDPRIKYIIANRWILDSRAQYNPWKWVRYNGSNPHTSHVHVSVMATPICDAMHWWNVPMLGGVPNPTPPPVPPAPMIPAFPLPRNEYFGDIRGPEASHGGHYEHERPWIKMIQRALIAKGYARWLNGNRVTDINGTWVDGIFGPETVAAVINWQRAHMPGTQYYGQVWWDDWARLLA